MKLKIHIAIFIVFLISSTVAYSQTQNETIATPSSTQLKGDSTLPNLNNQNKAAGDQIFPPLEKNADLDSKLKQNIAASSQILSQAVNPVPTPMPAPTANILMPPPAPAAPMPVPAANVPAPNIINFNPPPPYVNNTAQANTQPPSPTYFDMPNGVRFFSSNIRAKQAIDQTVELPATSVALGHLMEGIEVAINGDTQRIGITLDYAFLGPNGGYVQMKGCNLLVDVTAKYSFSRVRGNLVSLTCRSSNGQTFTLPVQGHIISATDKMEYKGLDGTIIMPGKGTAAVLTLLQGAVTSFGQAMAAAQVQTQSSVGQVGSPVQSSNVTGNQNYYIAGQTVAGAAGDFMKWFVDFYKGMEVGVAVEPGRKTFIMLEQTALIPKVFFGQEVPKNFVSFVNDKMKNVDDKNYENNSEEELKQNEKFNTAISDKSPVNILDQFSKDNKS